MTHTLFFDIAVNRFHAARGSVEPPRVVRIAWWRSDAPEPVCMLIYPQPGMTIDSSTLPYHGLTIERLEADGFDPADAIDALEKDASGATTILSYNMDHHWRNLYRLMQVEAAPPSTAVCVMKLCTPIIGIPAMRPGGGLKSPSLREARDFFGVLPPTGPEDPIQLALSTVRAVRGVYDACLAFQGQRP
jgi:hypothetical protein